MKMDEEKHEKTNDIFYGEVEFLKASISNTKCKECERVVPMTEIKMSATLFANKLCGGCARGTWLTFFNKLTYDTRSTQSRKKMLMRSRLIANAKKLRTSMCCNCASDERLWAYKDEYGALPFSIFAKPTLFKKGKIVCEECREDLMDNKPGNGKSYLKEAEKKEQQRKEEDDELDYLAEIGIDLKEEKAREQIVISALRKSKKKPKPIQNIDANEDDNKDRRPFLTRHICRTCGDIFPTEDYLIYDKDKRRVKYQSHHCSACRKEKQKVYSRRDKVGDIFSLMMKNDYDRFAKDLKCPFCENESRDGMKIYNKASLLHIHVSRRPWKRKKQHFGAHPECMRKHKALLKKKNLLAFEELDLNAPPVVHVMTGIKIEEDSKFNPFEE